MEKNSTNEKILWVTRLDLANALDVATYKNMIESLEQQGCSVILMAVGEDTRNIFKDKLVTFAKTRIKIKGFPLLKYLFFGYFAFIKAFVRIQPTALILRLENFWFTFPLILFVPGLRKKTIIDHRTPYFNTGQQSNLKDAFFLLLTKICFLYSALFSLKHTVINVPLKNYFAARFKFPKDRIGVWSSGVDLALFDPNKTLPPPELLTSSRFVGKFILMQHGMWSFNRGLLETIEAFRYIPQKDICLLLIGAGPAEGRMRESIKKHDLQERVCLQPAVELAQIPSYIRHCHCGILAYPKLSYWDYNVPLKLLEYLAMNKLVICPETTCFTDVAGKDIFCIFLKEDSARAIAEKIVYTYENFGGLAQKTNGREFLKKKYTWDIQATRLREFMKG